MRTLVDPGQTGGACEALQEASKLRLGVVVVEKVGRTKDEVPFPPRALPLETWSHQYSKQDLQQLRAPLRARITIVESQCSSMLSERITHTEPENTLGLAEARLAQCNSTRRWVWRWHLNRYRRWVAARHAGSNRQSGVFTFDTMGPSIGLDFKRLIPDR
jgi:hypothetical protein